MNEETHRYTRLAQLPDELPHNAYGIEEEDKELERIGFSHPTGVFPPYTYGNSR